MRRPAWILLMTLPIVECFRDAERQVRFHVGGQVEGLQPLLTVSATTHGWSLIVRGEDMVADSNYRSRPFDMPDGDILFVRAVLARPGGPPLAMGSTHLPIHRSPGGLVT